MKDFKYLKAGQPTKYEGEATIDKCIEYLESCQDTGATEEFVEGPHGGKLIRRTAGKVKFPNIGGLARHLEVHRTTVYEWAEVHEEFKIVLEALLSEQEDRILNNGLAGTYNSTIASLIAAKHGYKREVNTNITNPDGSMRPLSGLNEDQVKALADAEIAKNEATPSNNA